MWLYLIIFTAIFSTILFILSIIVEIINSRMTYGAKDEHETLKTKYRLILALIMSLSWAYILYIIII